MPFNGILDFLERNQIKNGCEGFFLDDLKWRPGLRQAWRNVAAARIAARRQRLATVKNGSAFLAKTTQRFLHRVNRADADQRSHQNPRVQRIADSHLFVGGDEPGRQLLFERAMHKHAPRASATLSRRPDRPK